MFRLGGNPGIFCHFRHPPADNFGRLCGKEYDNKIKNLSNVIFLKELDFFEPDCCFDQTEN